MTQQAPRVLVKSRNRKDPELLALDQKTLNPNRHYRWVRSRKEEYNRAVTKHKMRGYQLELNKDGGPKTLVEPDDRPDNVIAIGDLVLMSCPVEVHEQRQQDRKARTEALLASTSAETERMAKEKGISLIRDPDHNKEKQETR